MQSTYGSTGERIESALKLRAKEGAIIAACRTERFRDWVSGVFGHVCRAEYAVRAPSALRFSRACRDGPLSIAVHRAAGLPRPRQAGARTNIRFRFQAIVTRLHSPRTLSSPRSENCRNPSTDLIMPNTGSGVCLRSA